LKKLVLAFAVVLSIFALSAMAADMTGYVSDTKCAADVKKVESGDHAACAAACAGKGAVLVFVSDGKVYKVTDQAKVKPHAGHKVTISGKVDGDTLTVDSVKM
jgi:uncharacterized protein DUF5818